MIRRVICQDAHAQPKSCGFMTKGGVEPQLYLAFSCPAEGSTSAAMILDVCNHPHNLSGVCLSESVFGPSAFRRMRYWLIRRGFTRP